MCLFYRPLCQWTSAFLSVTVLRTRKEIPDKRNSTECMFVLKDKRPFSLRVNEVGMENSGTVGGHLLTWRKRSR